MEVNPNSPQSNGSSNALGNIQRPGDYLRQIRITQKRELSDVAKELNIPLKTLTALEQDEYTALPEATFIKGYYRTYAKFLKVDATTIIQRFDDIYANDTGLLPNHALNNSVEQAVRAHRRSARRYPADRARRLQCNAQLLDRVIGSFDPDRRDSYRAHAGCRSFAVFSRHRGDW